jgi:hypothetical protein
MTPPNVVQKHPAASTSMAGGTVATVAMALGLKQPWTTVVTGVLTVAPAVVVYLKSHGGIDGVVRSIFRGQS